MSRFEQAFAIIIGEEGGLSVDPADRGNWTGGSIGIGRCAGTKYGISAAAHPTLEIESLSLAAAQSVYDHQYWRPVHGDDLPPSLALVMFDAAVNCGVTKAVSWLQEAVGCVPDGVMGPRTLKAAQDKDRTTLICAHLLALRLMWNTTLPSWQHFGLGWTRRICALPYQTIS